MACCTEFPRRFLVVVLGFIGLLVSVGFRQCFALVMTHILHSTGDEPEESILSNCSVHNSSQDLHLNWTKQSVFLFNAAYFAGTIITQVPGGILAVRFSAVWVCGLSILISSTLFVVLPFAIKFHIATVYVIRVIQGLAEGGSVPALNAVVSAWAPKSERARLIAIAYAGAYLSPAVGLVATGMSLCRVSWDGIFYIYGGSGIVWSVLWLLVVYSTPAKHPNLGSNERRLFNLQEDRVQEGNRSVMEALPLRAILTSLPVYAIFVGAFCRNWIFSTIIFQFPQFFKDVFKMQASSIGIYLAAPDVAMTVVVITASIIVDKLISRRIFSITVARKLAQTVGFGTEAICIMVIAFTDKQMVAFILMCVGVGMSGFAISGYQVNPTDLSPQYSGVITGIGRIGSIGAVINQIVASQMTKGQDHVQIEWRNFFIIAASIHLAGVLFYVIFASGDRQSWAGGASTVTVNFESPVDYSSSSTERDPLLRARRIQARRRTVLEDEEYGSALRFLNTI